MAPVEKHTHTVKRGFKYTYFFAKAEQGKPTILWFHGFPESKHTYRKQLPYFAERGYGIICADMLGFDETDKPTDIEQYAVVLQCGDYIDILDHEGVEKAFIVGHDWGCLPASRILNVAPERCLGLCLIALGYLPPNAPFDIDFICKASKEVLGYETFGYFPFFGEPQKDGERTTSVRLIQDNIDSFVSLCFAEDCRLLATNMGVPGSLQKWLEAGKTVPTDKESFSDEDIAYYTKIIKRDINTEVCWYRAAVANVHVKHEKGLKAEVTKPCLFLAADRDPICVPIFYEEPMKKVMPDLEIVHFPKASHWLVSDEPDKANETLRSFLERKIQSA